MTGFWKKPLIQVTNLVERAKHAEETALGHVRVNHRGAHVSMAKQPLHRPDICAGLEQVRGERVAKRVCRGTLM